MGKALIIMGILVLSMSLILGGCVSTGLTPPGEEAAPAAGVGVPVEEEPAAVGVPVEEEAAGEAAAIPSPEVVSVDVELEVDSTDPEGVEFIAPESGSYEVTIVSGATSHLPETDPSWSTYGGWHTGVVLYINKPVEWGGPLVGDPQWGIEPINFDKELGSYDFYPTIEQAEAANQDASVTVDLDKNDCLIALEHDHLDYYDDNSGTVKIRITGP